MVHTMVHTIDSLLARIQLLESHIQSLLYAYYLRTNSIPPHAFKNFSKLFRHHVRSSISHQFFITTGNPHFIPNNNYIMKELASLWSLLSLPEKLHWLHT